MRNFASITDSLAKADLKSAVDNANRAMNDLRLITDRINRGEGTIGMLLNNDTLYTNLEIAASDLSSLLIDMRLNPERYVHFSVFGRNESKKEKELIFEEE